mgnify:CR=1
MELSWKEKRDELVRLVKKVSEQCGGEDGQEMEDMCNGYVKKYRDDLDKALNAIKEWEQQLPVLVGIRERDRNGYI